MWFFKRALCCSIFFLLVGCGFRPMLLQSSPGGDIRLRVSPIPEKTGVIFREYLDNAFANYYQDGGKHYLLKTDFLNFSDATITDVHNLPIYVKTKIDSHFRVINEETGYVVLSFSLTRLCGTPAGRSPYEGFSGIRNVKKTCLEGLARDVRDRVEFYFAR